MIKIGENPEKKKGINKFLSKGYEGVRGKIIALKENKKEAIILAMNSSIDGSVKWGEWYLIKEKNENEYPHFCKRVLEIPNTKEWKVK